MNQQLCLAPVRKSSTIPALSLQQLFSAPDDTFLLLEWPTANISSALIGPITPEALDGDLHHFVVLATDALGEKVIAKRFQQRWEYLNSIWPFLDSLLTHGPPELPMPRDLRLMANEDPFSQFCSVVYWLHAARGGDPIHQAVRQLAGHIALNEWGTSHPVNPEHGLASESKAKALFEAALHAQIKLWLAAVRPDQSSLCDGWPQASRIPGKRGRALCCREFRQSPSRLSIQPAYHG